MWGGGFGIWCSFIDFIVLNQVLNECKQHLTNYNYTILYADSDIKLKLNKNCKIQSKQLWGRGGISLSIRNYFLIQHTSSLKGT
jgi:hypothetical protein